MFLWRCFVLALVATVSQSGPTVAAHNTPALYQAIAAGKCARGQCTRGVRSSVFHTTPEQKRVLDEIGKLLTPYGRYEVHSVSENWSLDRLKLAMQSIDRILDGLPLQFFQGASPMIRGPNYKLPDFWQEIRFRPVRQPQRNVVPLIHHLYRLFRASGKLFEIRDTAVRLMKDYGLTTFVDPVEFPNTKYAIEPVSYTI